jgi:hypothetical protein
MTTRELQMKQAATLAKEIQAVTGLDIFRNTRKSDYIEARAIFNFMLYNTYKFRLQRIADFYKMNGKNMNHATILHSLNNFDVYRRFSNNVNDWLAILERMEIGENSKRDLMKQFINFLNEDNLNKSYDFMKDLYYQQEEIAEKLENVKN